MLPRAEIETELARLEITVGKTAGPAEVEAWSWLKDKARRSSPLASRRSVQAIPVIDLMGGKVVHARMGDRASYQPLESPLSTTSDPVAVVNGLLSVLCVSIFYALCRRSRRDPDRRRQSLDAAPDSRRVSSLARLWVDNGATDPAALETLIGANLGTPVVGSESQRDGTLIAQHSGSARIVLSLDFRGDVFQAHAKS